MPIFDGGRRKGNLANARAVYEEDVANYRQQVLVAFQEVETALAGLRLLALQADAESRAVVNSERASAISVARYRAGLVFFLDVLDAQRTALANRRAAAQIQGLQLVTSVGLIKALGGGWEPNEPVRVSAAPAAKSN
jgi:multidrug efflux system outer membrane protein